MRSAVRVSSVVAALTLIAASCGDDGGSAESPATSGGGEPESTAGTGSDAPASTGVPEAPAGSPCEATESGTQVDYGQYAPVASLDPVSASGSLVGGTELAAIYDVLVSFDFETEEYSPKLAESIEPNDDFTVWTLGLREGIEFSDSTPLDAEAVVASLERYGQVEDIRDPSASLLEMIEETRVVDELTVEFQLATPWAEFPHVLARGAGMIVNVNAVEDPVSFGANPPEAAGVGPYVVERNAPGEETVLRAREDYWGGPVCIETLRFTFVPGGQATYDAFQAGELDVAFLRTENVIQTVVDEGIHGHIVPQASGGALYLNLREGHPAADPRVREAMQLAIDPGTINERAQHGALTVGKGLIQQGTPYYSEGLEEPATDPERARTLLEEAKADGYDGQLAFDCPSAPPGPETSLAVEGMLEAVGFEVDAEALPTNDHIAKVGSGDFDVACWGVSFDVSSAAPTLLRNFHSESLTNRVGYSSPEMDDAIMRYLAAPDAEARKEVLTEINTIYVEDIPTLSYSATRQGAIWKPEVEGIHPTALSVYLFDKAYIAE